MRTTIKISVMGFLLGLVLSKAGFSDFGEVHSMLTFSDFRLLFVFMGAVMLIATGYFILNVRKKLPPIPFSMGAIISGGVLFGIGWALTGTCPAVAVVQLGEGKLAAIVTIIGIFTGIKLANLIKKYCPVWHSPHDCSD